MPNNGRSRLLETLVSAMCYSFKHSYALLGSSCHGRRIRGVKLTGIATVLVHGLIAMAAESAPPPDPFTSSWLKHVNSVKTLEATFTLLQQPLTDKRPYQVHLLLDLGAQNWKSTIVKPTVNEEGNDRIWEDQYGRTAKMAWRSTRSNQGKRRFDYEKPGSFISEGIEKKESCVPRLRRTFVPYHMTIVETVFGAKATFVSSTPSESSRDRTIVKYKITAPDGEGHVVYDVDTQNAAIIHSTKVLAGTDTMIEIQNQGFVERDGVWIPLKSITKHAGQGGRQSTDEITISDISFNRPFKPEEFLPTPDEGDTIYDSILGVRYNVTVHGLLEQKAQ